ncbi:hypothetical protein LTR10_012737 [Elasticomyces elasticus]|nr:hypothetical protein LTR10_012737 [Elasticomyces elasticus]
MIQLFLILLVSQLSCQAALLAPATNSLRRRTSSVHSFNLKRGSSNIASDISEQATRRSAIRRSAPILDNDQRAKYLVPVTVEGQVFELELDTGSADTWIIGNGFDCYSTYDDNAWEFLWPLSQNECNFGPTYTPGVGFSVNETMFDWTCYGQQEYILRCVAGPMGYASITLDAVTIQQLIAVPNKSSFPAQGQADQSGILGMGHSGMTNAFNASAESGVEPEGQIVYSPFAQTLFTSNLSPPLESAMFTLALSRDASNTGSGGIFTIGGVPENTLAVNISGNSTVAPWQFMASMSGVPDDQFTFYSIIIDGFDVGGQTEAAGLQIIIDSGANTVELPTALANILNQQWVPAPPYGDGVSGLDCDAVLPWPFGIQIGGKTYYISPEDLVGQDDQGDCYSLIEPSTAEEGFLVGDPFLKNVLAAFDWGNSQMEFWERQFYES